MQDKFCSLGSGRPSLINSANWVLLPVDNSDFPEKIEDDQEGSSEVEKGRILFTHMISLSEILAELLETVFTVRTTRGMFEFFRIVCCRSGRFLGLALRHVAGADMKYRNRRCWSQWTVYCS